MRRHPVRCAAVAVVAVTLGACGGNGNISDATRNQSTTTARPSTAVGGAGSQTVDTKFTGTGSTEYCRLARSYSDAQSKLNPTNVSPDLRQLFQDAARDIRLAVAVAPAEINNDVQVVADGFSALVAALAPVNYDFTRLTPDLIARFMSAEFTAASTRVAAYARNVCGVGG